ncbi:transposon Tf2-6 polyprotein [Trichonephila clavipes]|nr:transposon Tf2-6 polyprotein [Trichonephila clavipes]
MRGTLTSQRYVDDILRPHVGLFLGDLNGLPGAIFQQDNDRPHTERVAQDFVRHFQTLPSPARSPDLFPVEHVWDQLKQQMPSCHAIHDLDLAVQDLWAHLPQDNISRYSGISESRGQGFLEETSIMEYCINGIPDSPSNKLILYGCTTIQEFKEKLGIYMKRYFKIKAKNSPSYHTSRNPNFSSHRRDVEKLSITVTDDKPIYHSPRRLPFTERDIVDKQIDEWTQKGIIEPCSSAYDSQVLVVRKKDRSPRVCIDFRKLNRVLVKDHYPLPLIEDILDKLQDTRVFSTIDLRLTGYFRKVIPAYSVIAKPLSNLLRKDTPFNFDVKQKASFDELKRLLCQKPVLGIYRQNCETEIHTDASIYDVSPLGSTSLEASA